MSQMRGRPCVRKIGGWWIVYLWSPSACTVWDVHRGWRDAISDALALAKPMSR